MTPIDVKGLRIGTGIPKIIVSLMSSDLDACLACAREARQAGADCFELRADFFGDCSDADAVVALSTALRSALPENPLLFTFRSKGQGGEASLTPEGYTALNRAVIDARAADMIDIELGLGDAAVADLCARAKAAGLLPVVSHHDFAGTPSEGEICALLARMQDAGAGICKIAVMANSPADALCLSGAVRAFSQESRALLLGIAMGQAGSITRVSGELFGSCMTFCSLRQASAPGQLSVAQAKGKMEEIHRSIC